MALIIRIDVDRPYGKQPFLRHMLSRMGSDFFPFRLEKLGYLGELRIILQMLNEIGARAYIFFRRCTLPTPSIQQLIGEGDHKIGLHLEDSRSLESFLKEKDILEQHVGQTVFAVSKHGSSGVKQGFHHFPPYEPEKYVNWARQNGMRLFLGNLEDPSIRPLVDAMGFYFYPSAFWLEPAWRKIDLFTIDWLLSHAMSSDIVLLVHPENILADSGLTKAFRRILLSLESRILE
jgi:hypothetical protein